MPDQAKLVVELIRSGASAAAGGSQQTQVQQTQSTLLASIITASQATQNAAAATQRLRTLQGGSTSGFDPATEARRILENQERRRQVEAELFKMTVSERLERERMLAVAKEMKEEEEKRQQALEVAQTFELRIREAQGERDRQHLEALDAAIAGAGKLRAHWEAVFSAEGANRMEQAAQAAVAVLGNVQRPEADPTSRPKFSAEYERIETARAEESERSRQMDYWKREQEALQGVASLEEKRVREEERAHEKLDQLRRQRQLDYWKRERDALEGVRVQQLKSETMRDIRERRKQLDYWEKEQDALEGVRHYRERTTVGKTATHLLNIARGRRLRGFGEKQSSSAAVADAVIAAVVQALPTITASVATGLTAGRGGQGAVGAGKEVVLGMLDPFPAAKAMVMAYEKGVVAHLQQLGRMSRAESEYVSALTQTTEVGAKTALAKARYDAETLSAMGLFIEAEKVKTRMAGIQSGVTQREAIAAHMQPFVPFSAAATGAQAQAAVNQVAFEAEQGRQYGGGMARFIRAQSAVNIEEQRQAANDVNKKRLAQTELLEMKFGLLKLVEQSASAAERDKARAAIEVINQNNSEKIREFMLKNLELARKALALYEKAMQKDTKDFTEQILGLKAENIRGRVGQDGPVGASMKERVKLEKARQIEQKGKLFPPAAWGM